MISAEKYMERDERLLLGEMKRERKRERGRKRGSNIHKKQ